MPMADIPILEELKTTFTDQILSFQSTRDEVPTLWVAEHGLQEVLRFLKHDVSMPYRMLFDLTAIDERIREHGKEPCRDFTLVYQLLSFDRNEFIRLKVPLQGEYPSARSIVEIWPSANWYEREVWDLFGITFDGHPHLRRILLPPGWEGHPLRKEYPARATEMGPFRLPEEKAVAEELGLKFRPEDWGMLRHRERSEFMFLNVGPQHPGTHGPFRIILELDGEEIVDAVPDIGFHHRGAEKMAERQSWHTFIPYTDRIDYLGGVMNNFPYVLAVEKLAGIDVPDKAKVMRIMLAEFFRISSHLVYYGTFAQDMGGMSPVFYMFSDRERLFGVIEAICGGRMHPSWFRIGGVADDLPGGWDRLVRDFVDHMPNRLAEYERLVLKNPIFKARTKGVCSYTLEEAVQWGVTGAGLRACGLEWDVRKKMPYSGYDQFEFDVPVAHNGDCYDRAVVKVEELRQSIRIIEQCLKNMPDGPYKSRDRLASPPVKDRTMHDIETLITHFLNVSWGPVIPPGEAGCVIEATKGANGYHLTSDGNVTSYRTRIRTPSFAHLQMIPFLCRGTTIADLVALLGSIDFVMGDVDR